MDPPNDTFETEYYACFIVLGFIVTLKGCEEVIQIINDVNILQTTVKVYFYLRLLALEVSPAFSTAITRVGVAMIAATVKMFQSNVVITARKRKFGAR